MVLMKNIIMVIGFFILIINLFPNLFDYKIKEGIQDKNPPPTGCSASQRNIATQQAGEIDNLESRVLAFGSQLEQLDEMIKNQSSQILVNKQKIKKSVNDTKNAAKNAEKQTDIKMK